MTQNLRTLLTLHEELGCFGDYNKTSILCSKHCVLRLRCAIEQDQNTRLEILEDLVISQDLDTKIQ
jgi:hypothetical protein